MNPELPYLKSFLKDGSSFNKKISHEIQFPIMWARWGHSSEDEAFIAANEFYRKLCELVDDSIWVDSLKGNAEMFGCEVDEPFKYWMAFCYYCGDENEVNLSAHQAASMVLLIADVLLKELSETIPNITTVMSLSMRLKQAEAIMRNLFGASPIFGMKSFEEKTTASRKAAGESPSWWKEPLQEVINQTEQGLSWKLIFNRLVAMGDDVPHPQIKCIEYVDGKLKVSPANDIHNSRMITYRTLTSYKRPIDQSN
ncbi:hypothetical protein D8Y20_09650 [Mariprofundus sp. EBB-1]|uniref:hypothetical protein n=1 Tax=Mariprofundus sp. EBB-1 TaxID=2650971 RepID=UPI000EF1BB5C|nr:hypothetical protein [Mariprofundus sp. EBB-1]RLL51249.1 hypothetical protein D8Y20_09650 [Mariprofundus sp. EBB-1]